MFYRRLLLIVMLFFCSSVFAAETSLQQQEAERFIKESKFLLQHQRWDAALEKAETAVVLAPDNLQAIEQLITTLAASLGSLAVKGNLWLSGNPEKLTTKDIETGFSVTERLLSANQSLLEKSTASTRPNVAYLNNVARFLETIDLKILHETKLGENSFPVENVKTRLHDLRLGHFLFWTQSVYPSAVKQVVDEPSFIGWCWSVANTNSSGILNGLSFDNQAGYWKSQIVDAMNLSEKFDPELTEFINRNCLKYFESHAPLILAEAEKNGNREAKKIVADLVNLYRNNTKPYYQYRAWLIERETELLQKIGTDIPFTRHDPTELEYAVKASSLGFDAAVTELFESITKKIKAIPKEIKQIEYDCLYLSASRMIDQTKDTQTAQQRCLAICDLAFSRNDVPMRVLFHMTHDSESPDNLPEYQERIISLYDKALAIGRSEQQTGGRLEHLPPVSQAEQWRNSVAAEITTTTTTPKTITAWTEEILLLEPAKNSPDGRWFFRYDFTKLRKNQLYTLECSHQQNNKLTRLVNIDIPTGKVRYGKILNAPCFSDVFAPYAYRYRGDFPSFIDEENLYIGTQEVGLAVFPLSGEQPWMLSIEDDLPSNYVHGVGAIDGTIYLGLGKPLSQSWLVTQDTKSHKTKILASSAAKSGDAPFFDTATPPCFFPFFIDAKRHRLLFWVSTQNGPRIEQSGLWSIDGKTHRLEQRLQLECAPNKGAILPDGDHLLIDGHFAVLNIDLRDDSCELVVSLGGKRKIHPMKELLTPRTDRQVENPIIIDNQLWGLFFRGGNTTFGRLDLDNPKEIEWLPIEKLQAKETGPLGEPYDEILPLPDGSGVVVGDTKRIVLLRFQK
ncbi:MAG: hypothetical protein LBI18_02225 [Planctomycetaceae bacterium]|jgi:hypothetical protein|nr:hypothetical protein [Planctomycetaceae bacterium]